MAEVPDMLAMPGLLAGGVLLLVLGSNPVCGNVTKAPTTDATTTNISKGHNIVAIVVPTVLGVLVIALVVLVWFLCVVKKKRQTEGTYRPSTEEQSGVRSVEMPDALKLPKEERLI
ncbi:unnamed protein product [Merluccius merluccius]